MSYYRALGLEKEPFSTSPDPGFFYSSAGHRSALCRLQIAVALKRGMSVMVGDIGTGKTTVSRKLSQALSEDDNVVFRMILNPYFRTEKQFLVEEIVQSPPKYRVLFPYCPGQRTPLGQRRPGLDV